MLNKQIVLTAIILLCSVILFEFTNIDIWVQDHLYNFEAGLWLHHHEEKIAKYIFYDAPKASLILVLIALITGLLFFRNSRFIKTNKAGLWIVCLSLLLIPPLVGVLKTITNVPCPYNLTRYGGEYPHVTVLESYPKDFKQTGRKRCFPAGHASGGFALLSLLFLFKGRRNKRLALISVMIFAWSMGVYKMIIGDHFLSHTVITMVLAWLIILLIAKGVYRKFAVSS